jgi:hypothetical protein
LLLVEFSTFGELREGLSFGELKDGLSFFESSILNSEL